MKLRYFSIVLLLAGAMGGCLKDDLYNGPASVSNIAFIPASVTPNDNVTVSATITMVRGIQTAAVYYKVNEGGYLSLPMAAGSNDTYTATIPKQADKVTVAFYIAVTTKGGVESQSAEKTYRVGAVAPNYSAITLNEVDGNKKFVELYNNSDNAVNISGMAIIKNGTSLKNEDGSPLWVVPADVILPAKGFGIIKCSGYTATADPAAVIVGTVSDGMSAKQTLLLELTKPDGTVVNTFQRGAAPWGVTITAIGTTDSYSRCPDGTGAWKVAGSTAGKTNGAATGEISPN
jgi:hypothetical protein